MSSMQSTYHRQVRHSAIRRTPGCLAVGARCHSGVSHHQRQRALAVEHGADARLSRRGRGAGHRHRPLPADAGCGPCRRRRPHQCDGRRTHRGRGSSNNEEGLSGAGELEEAVIETSERTAAQPTATTVSSCARVACASPLFRLPGPAPLFYAEALRPFLSLRDPGSPRSTTKGSEKQTIRAPCLSRPPPLTA
jgi:hypothetical protein